MARSSPAFWLVDHRGVLKARLFVLCVKYWGQDNLQLKWHVIRRSFFTFSAFLVFNCFWLVQLWQRRARIDRSARLTSKAVNSGISKHVLYLHYKLSTMWLTHRNSETHTVRTVVWCFVVTQIKWGETYLSGLDNNNIDVLCETSRWTKCRFSHIYYWCNNSNAVILMTRWLVFVLSIVGLMFGIDLHISVLFHLYHLFCWF